MVRQHKADHGERTRQRVTELLGSAQGGTSAAGELLPIVYEQLRAIARQRMAGERTGHTLQATALVHEAYCRLVGERQIPWQSAGHFYAAAAQAMRRILLDHAKSRHRQKRGGGSRRIPLNVIDLADSENLDEVLSLEEALCRLEDDEPDIAAIVKLRFFAGLSIDDTAESLGISPRTVDRRWQYGRAWLYRALQDDN